MVFSEKSNEDKQKLKEGIKAVGILLAIFSLGPFVISEVTGVDFEELCVETKDEKKKECIENAKVNDIKSGFQEGLKWFAIAVAFAALVGLGIAGLKY